MPLLSWPEIVSGSISSRWWALDSERRVSLWEKGGGYCWDWWMPICQSPTRWLTLHIALELHCPTVSINSSFSPVQLDADHAALGGCYTLVLPFGLVSEVGWSIRVCHMWHMYTIIVPATRSYSQLFLSYSVYLLSVPIWYILSRPTGRQCLGDLQKGWVCAMLGSDAQNVLRPLSASPTLCTKLVRPETNRKYKCELQDLQCSWSSSYSRGLGFQMGRFIL